MAKLTAADVEKRIRDYEAKAAKISRRIICCGGTGCVANGSLRVRDALVEELKKAGQAVEVDLEHDSADHVHPGSTYVSKSGCQGFCQMGPLVRIEPDGIIYTKVRPEDALEIVQETVIKHNVIERLLYMNPSDGKRYKGEHEIPFYNRQHRLVLANCTIEPDSIGEYFHKKGYLAALKAYTQMTPEEVCSVMEESGLRGRGGGGFPTGRKWKFTLASPGPKKYVICNGDEGDPGAFMDRSVMEGNPHSVIEGMMIAARAIGANPLKAKAGALFHDIGKLSMPQYFTENNIDTANQHIDLNPQMSSLIIRDHVKEGLALARKYRLCRTIRDAIDQHHGDGLVQFFYNKALEESRKNGAPVLESQFRYTGKPPQDKEMAIISLADACEAASRSLDKPSAAKIEALVSDIFRQRYRDGQLNEANITLADLDKVRQSFVNTLISMKHGRIAYQKESPANGQRELQMGNQTASTSAEK